MFKAAAYVLQTSITAGTSNLVLAAVDKRRTFAQAIPINSVSDKFFYTIFDEETGDYEAGTGYLSGASLVRDAVIESTNNNTFVDFGTNKKLVSCDIPAKYQGAMQYNPSVDD